jgi:death-on-curing protein
MDYLLLPTELVEHVHDSVLNPGELPGRAGDKSLDGALARVENRLAFGLIEDVFDLAAAYCVAVAQGYRFNDGNKRTAFRVMQVCLDLHGLAEPKLPEDETGRIIIRVAQGKFEEAALAEWLRGLG